jgi:hypothetical protein
MISYLNATTVTSYYTAAITYGLPDVEKGCIQWLENNLMIETVNNKKKLSEKNIHQILI